MCKLYENMNEKIDELLKNSNLNIKRVGSYINSNTKIEWECILDGYKIFTKPYHVLQNIKKGYYLKCPICELNLNRGTNTKHKWTNEYIDKILKETNRTIIRIENYKNNKDGLIEFSCLIDGHKWKASVGNVINKKTGCPICSEKNKLKWTNETVDEYLIKNSKKIKRIGYIKNCISKTEFECLVCNNKWNVKFADIYNLNRGCPLCKHKGEKNIRDLILKYNKFNEFKHHKRYRIGTKLIIVDFYIENLNNIKIIIEYNGSQHYIPNPHFGGQPQFEKQQKRDEELRQYCIQNNIHLLEIPYTMKDEEIIAKLIELNNI